MKTIKQLPLILGILTISLAAFYLAFAWTEPGVTPPGSNIDAPLNTSINAQAKEGALVLGMNEAVEIGLAIQHGKVGVGVIEPKSALDIAGEAKLSSSGDACSVDNEGAIRYLDSDECFYMCDGESWIILSCIGRYILTMADDGYGTAVDITGMTTYSPGTVISIKATANTGYKFEEWSAPAGSFVNATNSETFFTMPTQDVTITANFSIAPCDGVTSMWYGGDLYSLVEIGNQCWFADNLNVTDDYTDQTSCYFARYCNDCDIYGALYSYTDAMCGETVSGAQGICPDGWHIPTYDEVNELLDYLGTPGNGSALAGTEETWEDGELVQHSRFDESGFNLLGGGYYQIEYESSSMVNWYGIIGTSSGSDWMIRVSKSAVDATWTYEWEESEGHSIRCLKD